MHYTRVNIYLTAKQYADLKAIALADGIKTAELIRSALNKYVEERKR